MKIKNVGIIGLGSVGVTLGNQIIKKGNSELYILVDETRKNKYEKEGIYINNKKTNFNYVIPGDNKKFDLVIFCVKQGNLKEAIKTHKNFISSSTIIMSLLNGIKSEEEIISVFGDKNVLYSFIVSNIASRENTNFNILGNGTIFFGTENNNPNDEKVLAIKSFFDELGIKYIIPRDIKKRLWWKLMVNVGLNQLSAILRADFNSLKNSEEVKNMLFLLMEEVVLIAQKENINLTKEDIIKWYTQFNKFSPTGKTSMLYDIEKHSLTEVDIFAGEIIKLGKKHNIPTPANEMIYNNIKYIESTY